MHVNTVMRLIFVLSFLIFIDAAAAIEKEISFQATPAAVKVFQLKGTKKNLIGTTPFKHTIKFHSEHTRIRFLFEKPGYESQTLEANIKKNKLRADLSRKSILVDPSQHKSQKLQNMQKQVNRAIDPLKLQVYLKSDTVIDSIVVEEQGENTNLIFMLSRPDTAKKNSKTLQQIWEKELLTFVYALRDQLSLPNGIDKIIIALRASMTENSFNVQHNTVRKEVCNGGYQFVYISTGGYGEYYRQWNPCLTKSTVETTESNPVLSQKNVRKVHEFELTSSQYQNRSFTFETVTAHTK